MIGIAILEITYPGEAPYKHRHIWMSEGPEYALVELIDWERETQEAQGCTLKILEWKLEERPDMGY